MFFVYLLSGLFLGWSLGANDAANVYGTAVGTRMLRFRTAAITASVFILLGAVFGGAGAAHTLGKLGAVNALPGSFTVALAAALTVTGMTWLKLPVSTSQAVVGAIIGWNFFSGSRTDMGSLSKIVVSWVLCPVLAAVIAMVLLKLAQVFVARVQMHLFRQDLLTRGGLFVVGAFAAYSLGANNIANVVGVFVPASPFDDLSLGGLLTLSGPQQLFLLGALAIAVGVFTYSKKVMMTVGSELFRLSPIMALVVVLAQAIVLFLFASEGLENWLSSHGLPTIPLVPVSSSQAVIGAVIGVGLLKGGHNLQFRVLGRIASGWVSTPIIAGGISFVTLFVVQNVFVQNVYEPVRFEISEPVVAELQARGLYADGLDGLVGQTFEDSRACQRAIRASLDEPRSVAQIVALAQLQPMVVDIDKLDLSPDQGWLTEPQLLALFRLHGRRLDYAWQLDDALATESPAWRLKPPTISNKLYNKGLSSKLAYLHHLFEVD